MGQRENHGGHHQIQQQASNRVFAHRRKMGNTLERKPNTQNSAAPAFAVEKIEPAGQQGGKQKKQIEIFGM
jgi:hypothetical protein